MKALMRSRMWLFTAGAAAFAGGLALLISNGERISEAARLASANAAPTSAAPASGWNDFLLCHTPPKAATAITSSMIRLAAAQTEAPQAKTNAASPALAFADTDPPVWDGLGSLSYKEPVSKSFEENNEAGKLDKAEEIAGVVLPANRDPALPLNPGEEALDEPASHVAA